MRKGRKMKNDETTRISSASSRGERERDAKQSWRVHFTLFHCEFCERVCLLSCWSRCLHTHDGEKKKRKEGPQNQRGRTQFLHVRKDCLSLNIFGPEAHQNSGSIDHKNSRFPSMSSHRRGFFPWLPLSAMSLSRENNMVRCIRVSAIFFLFAGSCKSCFLARSGMAQAEKRKFPFQAERVVWNTRK